MKNPPMSAVNLMMKSR